MVRIVISERAEAVRNILEFYNTKDNSLQGYTKIFKKKKSKNHFNIVGTRKQKSHKLHIVDPKFS